MSELITAMENAVSFSGAKPPSDASEIGRVLEDTGTYIFYRDSEGNYYYNTEAGLKFAKEIESAKRVKK